MQFLFERLADAEKAIDIAEAVRQQVQRLVSIHVWEGDAGLHLMNLGIAPVADVHNIDQLGQLAARVHTLIERNEPRLVVVRVDVDASTSHAHPARLVVTGRLRGEDEIRALTFELPRH